MSKIGKKLILSYFLIVAVLVVVLLSIIRISFENNLNSRIIDGLKSDAHNISQQIESDLKIFETLDNNSSGGSVNDVFPSDAAFKYSVRFASTNIFILNQSRRLIYESWKDDMDYMDFINSPDRDDSYFAYESEIENVNGETIGYVITMAKKEDVSNINTLLTSASLISVTISLAIAMVLSFIFEKILTDPIKKLKKNINQFELSRENNWIEINSRDEIADLNEDFRLMTKNLVKYDKQQKEFFQNSSHELKTPLMSIISYAEAIKDGIVIEKDVDKFLDIIIDESNKLNQIVNNIMYMTKIDSSFDKDNTPTNLEEVIDDIITRFSAYANENGIELVKCIEEDIVVKIKEEHIFMVLSNLVSNALRYADKQIIISAKKQNNKVVMEVCDDGNGFEEKEIPRVFDRFFKGEKGLSGLGLAIVKSIAEKNNAEVYAYNKENYGACIKIII